MTSQIICLDKLRKLFFAAISDIVTIAKSYIAKAVLRGCLILMTEGGFGRIFNSLYAL